MGAIMCVFPEHFPLPFFPPHFTMIIVQKAIQLMQLLCVYLKSSDLIIKINAADLLL